MSIETFFDNFELLTDSPNAVAKLREIILQLAVRGKLVTQNLNDEPAIVLLEKVDIEQGTLLNVVEVSEEQQPFTLPPYWRWVYFERILKKIHYGYTASANFFLQDVRLLRITDIHNNTVDWAKVPGCEIAEYDLDKFALNEGDLLIARTGGTIGKSYLVDSLPVVAVFASYLIRAIPCSQVYPKYLKVFLDSRLYWKQLYEKSMGTGQPNVNATALKSLVVPIPPLAEQKRIVEKCDRLMLLCDEIEKRQQQRQEKIVRMNESAIAQLLSSQNTEEFRQHWQRICDNFDLLYSIPENISKLRQAILQLAVQGKLVSQNSNDEPAKVLLETIKTEREKLIKAKKIKKTDSLPINESTQFSYRVPEQWQWARLGYLVEKLGAGSTPLGGKNVYVHSGIKFLRSQNVWNDGLSLDNVVYITPEIHQRMSGTVVEPGDILLNITGASIGRCAVVPDDFDEGNVSQHVSIIRLIDKSIRHYIHLCFISTFIQRQIMEVQVGISREGLSMTRLKDFLVPLPPLAEQKRIVAKCDRLMSLCDALEAKLNKARESGDNLMEVAARQVLVAEQVEKSPKLS